MKSINLLENGSSIRKGLTPNHYMSTGTQAILFTLQPGQSIREHNAPSSPFYVVVLNGRGMFAVRTALNRRLVQTCCLYLIPLNSTLSAPWMSLSLLVSCMVRQALRRNEMIFPVYGKIIIPKP